MKLMGSLNSEETRHNAAEKKVMIFIACSCGTWRDALQILTITLLSLLFPLSFLLLARISTVRYILAVSGDLASLSLPSNVLSNFLFLHSDSSSTIIHSLLSIVTVAAFVHVLTDQAGIFSVAQAHYSSELVFRLRLYASWIFICTLQVCVVVGIEGSIAVGIDGSGFSHQRKNLSISRVLFILGLHETMLFWSKTVVKPVVDDTVLCFAKEEGWLERVAIAVSFGALWWWTLRDEVDSLVTVAELKRELLVAVGVADFVTWWLYYLTVSIGIIRIINALIWLGKKIVFRRNVQGNISDFGELDEKV